MCNFYNLDYMYYNWGPPVNNFGVTRFFSQCTLIKSAFGHIYWVSISQGLENPDIVYSSLVQVQVET